MRNRLSILIIILAITGLILPSFTLAQKVEVPKDLEEAKEMGKKFGEETKEELPGILERIWEEEVLPIWKRMRSRAEDWWNSVAWPRIKAFFRGEVQPRLEEEIEKRKPGIEEELKKEKEELEQELREEMPDMTEGIWERLRELLKENL